MTFGELQKRVDDWIPQYEAGYWPPLANLGRLIEEVGELSREINHHYGPKKKKDEEGAGSIAEELGDIIFTVTTIANSLQIDLDQVVEQNLRKVVSRDSDRWQLKGKPTLS